MRALYVFECISTVGTGGGPSVLGAEEGAPHASVGQRRPQRTCTIFNIQYFRVPIRHLRIEIQGLE